VSEYASEQAPTKLGLKPGQIIAVEDAIKAIVTKSANNAAVSVAENLGGDESRFAQLMTKKARDLGMTGTTYTNASGLPDDAQITTARGQALLGRLIQKRFPRYYKYFSTESFVYHGETMRNHNQLLGSIEGVDGIKTGFTRASGFNLVTSVHHDGRYIVAVVMGGRSSLERDAHMRELISAQIKGIPLKHAAPAIAKSNPRDEPRPALANASVACSHHIGNAHFIRARGRAKRHRANGHCANRKPPLPRPRPLLLDVTGDNPAVLISAFRHQHGEGSVTMSAALTGIAQAMRDSLDHNVLAPFSNRIGRSGFSRTAENIAFGHADFASTLDQWTNSAGHRANLLLYGAKLIGVAHAQNGHRIYWAMVIGAK
jgi:hypothetical protein